MHHKGKPAAKCRDQASFVHVVREGDVGDRLPRNHLPRCGLGEAAALGAVVNRNCALIKRDLIVVMFAAATHCAFRDRCEDRCAECSIVSMDDDTRGDHLTDRLRRNRDKPVFVLGSLRHCDSGSGTPGTSALS